MAGISRFEKECFSSQPVSCCSPAAGSWPGRIPPSPIPSRIRPAGALRPGPGPPGGARRGERPDSLLPGEVIDLTPPTPTTWTGCPAAARQGGGHSDLSGGARLLPERGRSALRLRHRGGHIGEPASLCDGGRRGRDSGGNGRVIPAPTGSPTFYARAAISRPRAVLRPCLKIGNVPDGEGFFARQGDLTRQYLCIARKINAVWRKKNRRLGILTCFKHGLGNHRKKARSFISWQKYWS